MSSLDSLRSSLTQYLQSSGLPAVSAWSDLPRAKQSEPAVVVSLRSCAGGPAGLQNYLGDTFDPVSRSWRELYGFRAELTFGLDIWGPRGGGEKDCIALFSQVAQSLAFGAPRDWNFKIRSTSCGETSFDSRENRFHCPAQAVADVFLTAYVDESGAFTDFIVKGSML